MKWKKIQFFFYLNNYWLWISFYLHSYFCCWGQKKQTIFNFQKNVRNFKKIDFLSPKSEKNFQFLFFDRAGKRKNQFQYRSNFFHKRHIIKIHLQRSMLLSWKVSRKNWSVILDSKEIVPQKIYIIFSISSKKFFFILWQQENQLKLLHILFSLFVGYQFTH